METERRPIQWWVIVLVFVLGIGIVGFSLWQAQVARDMEARALAGQPRR